MSVFSQARLREINSRKDVQKKHTVLVVDDEEANIKALTFLLKDNYHILQAKDGQSALDLVQGMENPEKISLILCDQRMPRMTGVEFFEKVTAIIPKAIRIIVTGYMDVDVIIDSINKAEIYKFITKPYDQTDILFTVRRAIESFELQTKLDDYLKTLEERVRQRTAELEEKNKALEAAYKALEEVSLTDPLTGMKNRRFLLKHLHADVAKARRDYENWARTGAAEDRPSKPLSDLVFFLVDMDHFKSVNDTYGHAAGDQVLIQCRQLLEKVFRESDFLVRWGGEEFLVVARFIKREDAALMAERIRKMMADHIYDIGDGQTIRKSCSIGFACYPFHPNDPGALNWSQVVDIADQALYVAKRSGRDAWVGLSSGEGDHEDFYQRFFDDPETMVSSGEVLAVSSFDETKKLIWQTRVR